MILPPYIINGKKLDRSTSAHRHVRFFRSQQKTVSSASGVQRIRESDFLRVACCRPVNGHTPRKLPAVAATFRFNAYQAELLYQTISLFSSFFEYF